MKIVRGAVEVGIAALGSGRRGWWKTCEQFISGIKGRGKIGNLKFRVLSPECGLRFFSSSEWRKAMLELDHVGKLIMVTLEWGRKPESDGLLQWRQQEDTRWRQSSLFSTLHDHWTLPSLILTKCTWEELTRSFNTICLHTVTSSLNYQDF